MWLKNNILSCQQFQKHLRRFSLQALQKLLPDDFGCASNESTNESSQPSTVPKKSKATGVFKEKDVGFSRMSFNTRLNNPKKTAMVDLGDLPEEGNTLFVIL